MELQMKWYETMFVFDLDVPDRLKIERKNEYFRGV